MGDRLQVRFLGTGTAFNCDGRLSQAILVEPPGARPFLVDLGQDTMTAFARQGLDPAAIDRIFVTHLHGDHVAGWPFLLLHFMFVHRRDRPLHVHGPVGTAACLDGLMRLCYGEIVDDLTFPVQVVEHPVAAAEGLDAGEGIRFDLVPMVHHPTSIGYRFHVAGNRVAVTGDTAWCPGLERLAAGSDLLVLECTTVEEHEMAHVSLEEIRAGRDRLEAAQIVLTHLPDAVATALAVDPIRGVLAAHDGLVHTA